MNCRRVISLMSAYVDGELTGTEMLEIRRHLSSCPECEAEHQSIALTKQMIARLATVAPRQEFAASILSRLHETEVPAYQRALNVLSRFAHRRLSPVAAALAASGVALVLLSAGGMDVVQTPPQAPVAAAPTMVANMGSASLLPELPDGLIPNGYSEKLTVADQSSDLGAINVDFARLSVR